MVDAWEILSQQADRSIWKAFENRFAFKPSCPADGLVIAEPTPSTTYDVSAAYAAVRPEPDKVGGTGDQNSRLQSNILRFENSHLIVDLHEKSLAAFRSVVVPGTCLQVLDWQHDSYRFYPHLHVDAADYRSWKTTVFPDGDYYIFLADYLSFGTFGHPWEETICVFGQKLLDAFEADPPNLFANVLRRDGVCYRPQSSKTALIDS